MSKTKTILIIEDNSTLRQRVKDRLEEEGFNVLESDNGRDGLAVALDKHPDLILLDIVMPQMDGLTVLKKLRQDEWGKSVPVIVLTVLTDDKKVFDALNNDVYDFLIKGDWNEEDVVERVKSKLGL